jgi:hypothetical protein
MHSLPPHSPLPSHSPLLLPPPVAEVSPHAYEALYLEEVRLGSQYIAEATAQAWATEAAMRDEAAARLSPSSRAREAARLRRREATGVSWWAQDVEEGHVFSSAADMAAAEGDGQAAGVVISSSSSALVCGSAGTSLGSLLQRVVRGWAAADAARVEGVLRAGVEAGGAPPPAAAAPPRAATAVASVVDAAPAVEAGGADDACSPQQLEVTRIVDDGGAGAASVDIDEEECGENSAATAGSVADTVSFSLADDGGLEIFSPSSVAAIGGGDSAVAAFGGIDASITAAGGSGGASSLSADGGEITVAEVLSDAISSLNATARAAAAEAAAFASAAAYTGDVSGLGGNTSGVVPEAERAFFLNASGAADFTDAGASCALVGDLDDDETGAEAVDDAAIVAGIVCTEAAGAPHRGAFSPVRRMVLDGAAVAGGGEGVVAVAEGGALATPRGPAPTSALATPRSGVSGVASSAPASAAAASGNPFGGIRIHITSAVAASGGDGSTAAGGDAVSSLASSLGAEADDACAPTAGAHPASSSLGPTAASAAVAADVSGLASLFSRRRRCPRPRRRRASPPAA